MTLPEKCKTSWKDHVKKVIHAYNCTKDSSTGFSPYYLMFGRKPRLPIDIILQTEVDPPHSTHRQYLENWKEVMEDAYKSQRLDKLEQGDKALVRNLTPRGGPGKLRPYWESEIAEAISRYKNYVTFKIKSKSYPNKTTVLHRNMLMPVNHLLDTIDTVPTISQMKKKYCQKGRLNYINKEQRIQEKQQVQVKNQTVSIN